MLYINDGAHMQVKSERRVKKQPKGPALYEVMYEHQGVSEVCEVYAKNEGEANRKAKSKHGSINIIDTQRL